MILEVIRPGHVKLLLVLVPITQSQVKVKVLGQDSGAAGDQMLSFY